MGLQIGNPTVYHLSKTDFGFMDKKALEIWDRIEKKTKDGFFSKKRDGSFGEFYLDLLGDFRVYLDTEGDKKELFKPIIFEYADPADNWKKQKIAKVEKYLKSLRTNTPGENYVLKRASHGDSLFLLGSVGIGGVQWSDNPGYVYAMEFEVSEWGHLKILAYSKYAIKILSDFCKEAKLNIHA